VYAKLAGPIAGRSGRTAGSERGASAFGTGVGGSGGKTGRSAGGDGAFGIGVAGSESGPVWAGERAAGSVWACSRVTGVFAFSGVAPSRREHDAAVKHTAIPAHAVVTTKEALLVHLLQ